MIFAVMTADPGRKAVTFPLLVTVATRGELEDQETFRVVPVTFSCLELLALILREVALKRGDSTLTL